MAPEVFSRHFGRVSHKADVYSYGMLVLEMVRGKKNIGQSVEHTSDLYFPHSIYKKLECDGDIGLHGIESEEDEKTVPPNPFLSLPSRTPISSSTIQISEENESCEVESITYELLSINPPYCKSRIKDPVFQEGLHAFWRNGYMTVEELVKQGFEADYHEMDKFQACDSYNDSGGECGTDTTTNQAICFCHDGHQSQKCQA
ncbi:unnamed protein product [Camellia sinensis]